jgi:hypothetical protein
MVGRDMQIAILSSRLPSAVQQLPYDIGYLSGAARASYFCQKEGLSRGIDQLVGRIFAAMLDLPCAASRA